MMHRCNNCGKTFEGPYRRVGIFNSVLYCLPCFNAYIASITDKEKRMSSATVTKPKESKKSKKVTAQDIYLGLLVDRSGSMSSCRENTLNAFNMYLNDRKGEEGNTTTWLTLFNTSVEFIAEGRGVKDVPELTTGNYIPAGGTALHDAIGNTVRRMEDVIKKSGFQGKVLFVIQTDGYENSSREWSKEGIQALIKEKEAEGNWTFVYLGADQDAFAAAQTLGVGAGNTVSYATADNNFNAIRNTSASTASYRASADNQTRTFVDLNPNKPLVDKKRKKAVR